MFDSLTTRLTRVLKTLRGEARLTEANTQEMLREIRVALLEADPQAPDVDVATAGGDRPRLRVRRPRLAPLPADRPHHDALQHEGDDAERDRGAF